MAQFRKTGFASKKSKNSSFLHLKNSYSPLVYPILVITLCALFMFYKYILQNFPSVISVQLMTDFDLQGFGLGMLSGVYFWTYLIVPLFVGIIIDRYGVRWVTTGAILSCALGILWFSQVQTINMAVLARALTGVGVSFATIAYMKVAATWFPTRWFALLTGLAVSAAMAGAVAGQMPLAWLVHHVGWRDALYDLGEAGFILAIIFMIVMREPENSLQHEQIIKKEWLPFSDVLQVFRSKQNWLLMLYSGLALSPLVIFGGLWGNPFLQAAYHLDPMMASSLVSLVFLGLGIGGPFFGILSVRVSSRRNLMIYSSLMSSLSIILVLYCHPMPTFILGFLLFLFGFGLGAFSIVFVIGKELNPIKLAGTTMAMINASDALLDAITEPAIGKILDIFKDGIQLNGAHHFSLHAYHIALAILPIYQIMGALLLLWVKDKRRGSPTST